MGRSRAMGVGRMVGVVAACVVGGALGSALMGGHASATRASLRAEPTAVATVDIPRVLEGLTEAAEARTRLGEVVKAFQSDLDAVRAEQKQIVDQLELVKDRGTPEALRLVAKRVELEATGRARAEGLQRLIDIEEGRTLRAIFLKVQDAAKRLAEQQGYDVILFDDRANVPPERVGPDNQSRPIAKNEVNEIVLNRRVLAVSGRSDISQAVIDFMNNEYKAGSR